MHTVHVRVNDAATGKPTPCRVRFTDAEGRYYAPFGRLTDFVAERFQDVGGNVLIGDEPYAYIDGTCEIRLPVGPIHVDITKGPEYTPLCLQARVGPGKLALRFTIGRRTNWRVSGWYSGDACCHTLSPHAALLEGAAEDLAVVNLLAMETATPAAGGRVVPAVPNLLAFSGQRPALERPDCMVVVNTLNWHPVLGSLGLLNCHRVVYPLSFGVWEGGDDWTLGDWCDQCHRKGGLVLWHNAPHDREFPVHAGPLAETVLGRIDAFEMESYEDSAFDALPDWYRLLNAGVNVPLAGGSGKGTSGTVLGAMRTYARLPEGADFTYKNWIEAVRAGRTFATNGPLLSLEASGRGPGETLEVPTKTARVAVSSRAESNIPFDRLEIVADGSVVAETAADESGAAALEMELPLERSCWLAARCRGGRELPYGPPQRLFAHTSPIYVRMEGRPPAVNPSACAGLVGLLDEALEWVLQEARCETDAQRQRLAAAFTAARQELLRRSGGA